MKTANQLKKELHEYIDSITDKETLMMVHEEVATYLKKDSEEHDEVEDYLTGDQEKELEEAIRQADSGETISFSEFKKKMKSWHTK